MKTTQSSRTGFANTVESLLVTSSLVDELGASLLTLFAAPGLAASCEPKNEHLLAFAIRNRLGVERTAYAEGLSVTS